jgi:pimeloyl-ACP methyl ester carboxylesterase
MLARRQPMGYLDWLAGQVGAADRLTLARPAVRAMFADDLPEAFRQGVGAFAHDLRLLAGPWGFRLEDIGTEVQLWHGQDDLTVPLGVARQVAAALPECRPAFLESAGHFLALDHWQEILSSLVSRQD